MNAQRFFISATGALAKFMVDGPPSAIVTRWDIVQLIFFGLLIYIVLSIFDAVRAAWKVPFPPFDERT